MYDSPFDVPPQLIELIMNGEFSKQIRHKSNRTNLRTSGVKSRSFPLPYTGGGGIPRDGRLDDF